MNFLLLLSILFLTLFAETDLNVYLQKADQTENSDFQILSSSLDHTLIQSGQQMYLIQNKNLLQPFIELDQNQLIQTEKTNKSLLATNLLIQMKWNQSDSNSTLYYYLEATYLYFGYNNGTQSKQIYSIPQQDYQFIDFQVTQIDGLLSLVTCILKKHLEDQIDIYNWLVYPFKFLESERKLKYSPTNCKVKQFSQYKSRNNLVIFIVCQDQLLIAAASIQNNTLQYNKVAEYNRIIFSHKTIENYLLITQEDGQYLYYVQPLTYGLILLKEFTKQPIEFIRIYENDQIDLILVQENESGIDVYQGLKSPNWQLPIKIIFLQNLDIKFYGSLLYIKEKAALLIGRKQSLYPICLQGTIMNKTIYQDKNGLSHFFMDNCQRCEQSAYDNSQTIYTNPEDVYNILSKNNINAQVCLLDCTYLNKNPNDQSPAYQYCNTNQCSKYNENQTTFNFQSIIYQISLMSNINQQYEKMFLANYPNQSLTQLAFTLQNYTNQSIIDSLISTDQCEMNCAQIYPVFSEQLHELNSTLVNYQGQCILSDAFKYLLQSCEVYWDCNSCEKQLGCSWNKEQCSYEDQFIDIQSYDSEQSSQWWYAKQFRCKQQNSCSYNQTLFNSERSITLTDIFVQNGQICSWYFDANELSFFRLQINSNSNQTKAKSSICLGVNENYLCDLHKLTEGFQDQTYTFTSHYFRFTVEFEQDAFVEQIVISVQHLKPSSIFQQLKKTLLHILIWIVIGIIIIFSLCYLARRRLYYLVGQAQMENDAQYELQHNQVQSEINSNQLLPLSTERLNIIMHTLQEQEVVAKYPQDESLMLYGESNCSFCLENYDESDVVAQLFCGHLFHYKCFELWIRQKGQLEKCPICNQKVDYFLANKQVFATIRQQMLNNISDIGILK